jgi:hypothetical protein
MQQANQRALAVPDGYDTTRNPRVASFAAQLDDQLALLKKATAELEVRHLEWQPHPGVNTVGMLLAHLAIVDVWWISLAPKGGVPEADVDTVFKGIIGIGMDDDGLPLPPAGHHPATLAGKPLAFYYQLLDTARAATHTVLRGWSDSDLSSSYELNARSITKEWTAYHVLEHFAGHFGQVLLLKHLMRDAGLLPRPEK